MDLTILVLTTVGLFFIVIVLSGYDASRTRRKFIEEFNTFVQSLASRKD